MRSKLLVALSVSLIALAGTTMADAQSSGRALSQSAVQQAAQQHPQVVEEFGGPVDPRLDAYVAGIGRRIAPLTGVRGGAEAYRVTTLNSPVRNAFAVPGGFIYVTRELLALMNDEAELAFVLGHEMGHVAARHGQQRQSRSVLSQLGALLAATITGSQAVGQLFGTVGQTFLLKYSRSQENESDALGVRYISAGGYDPSASSRILGAMGAAEALDAKVKGEDQRSTPSWARSHPLSQDRVRRTTALATQMRTSAAAARNRDQYLAAIDGLIVGDDPRQGVIEGSQFLHPALRIRFTAPQGYGMQNGARAVTISGSNGQAQFASGTHNGDLDAYISRVFQALAGNQTAIDVPTPRTTNVNGIPAAYSLARVRTQQGQADVGVFAYRWDGDTAYHFLTVTKAGSGFGPFGSMVGSLRSLTSAEAAVIRPRILDIVTVRPGDSLQSLAGRMAYGDYQLDRFLTLNGLSSNSRLVPGERVKIVVYGS